VIGIGVGRILSAGLGVPTSKRKHGNHDKGQVGPESAIGSVKVQWCKRANVKAGRGHLGGMGLRDGDGGCSANVEIGRWPVQKCKPDRGGNHGLLVQPQLIP